MLGTPRDRVNGPLFVLGWMLGLAVVGAIVHADAGGAAPTRTTRGDLGRRRQIGARRTAGAAGRQAVARAPDAGKDAALPKWMQTIDRLRPARVFGIAVALSGVIAKNLLPAAGAAATIAQTGGDTGEQDVALGGFILVATLGPGVPVAIYFALGDRAKRLLGELKLLLGDHRSAIMAVLCLVIGAELIGDGMGGLG
jgi:hypothetical protein